MRASVRGPEDVLIDNYCNGCIYLGKVTGGLCCSFCDVTGHSRGCPSGQGCTCKKTGNREHSPNYFTYQRSSPEKKEEKAKPAFNEYDEYERERARKKRSAARTRAELQGRQKAVILAFRDSIGVTSVQLAAMVGVKPSTLSHWLSEDTRADWGKLAALGIQKPDGVP